MLRLLFSHNILIPSRAWLARFGARPLSPSLSPHSPFAADPLDTRLPLRFPLAASCIAACGRGRKLRFAPSWCRTRAPLRSCLAPLRLLLRSATLLRRYAALAHAPLVPRSACPFDSRRWKAKAPLASSPSRTAQYRSLQPQQASSRCCPLLRASLSVFPPTTPFPFRSPLCSSFAHPPTRGVLPAFVRAAPRAALRRDVTLASLVLRRGVRVAPLRGGSVVLVAGLPLPNRAVLTIVRQGQPSISPPGSSPYCMLWYATCPAPDRVVSFFGH